MKKHFLLIALAFICKLAVASCPPGYTEVIVQIVPDAYAITETSWSISDVNGTILTQGTVAGDTICVPDTACMRFAIHDNFGDGLIAPAGFWLYLNGSLVANNSNFGYDFQYSFNCPQGSNCSTPLSLNYGFYMASFDNTWYVFTPDSTGTYNITTCTVNTCDTKIWIYTNCPASNNETPAGTYAFNDNANCGLQANLDVILIAGQTYYIRIGDNLDNCIDPVFFYFQLCRSGTGLPFMSIKR